MSGNNFLTLQNLDQAKGFDYIWLWEKAGGKPDDRLSEISISFNLSEKKFNQLLNDYQNKKIVYSNRNAYVYNSKILFSEEVIQQLEDNLYICYINQDKEIINIIIYYLIDNNESINLLLEKINKCRKREKSEKGIFYTLRNDGMDISLMPMKIDFYPKDLALNYGDEFLNENEKICKFIESKKSGLVILSGDTGTGKTSYFRYLINKYSKKFLIINLHFSDFDYIMRPEFTNFLSMQKDSIVIVEDAETLLVPREEGNFSNGITNLLNLTDGLLGDQYRLKVFVTFNEFNQKRVDSALLRPGRMVTEYKFNKLPIEYAKRLAEHEGINFEINQPMSLAEIYNQKIFTKKGSEKSIGF